MANENNEEIPIVAGLESQNMTETHQVIECKCGSEQITNDQCDCALINEDVVNPLHENNETTRTRRRNIESKWNQHGKKYKLRTSKDIYDRLKWDSQVHVKNDDGSDILVDTTQVYIGYKDRFLGTCEVSFEEFQPGGDIPFHRLYYFRTGGPPVEPFIGQEGEVKVREDNLPEGAVFVWDRDTRIDLIFNSGNSTALL